MRARSPSELQVLPGHRGQPRGSHLPDLRALIGEGRAEVPCNERPRFRLRPALGLDDLLQRARESLARRSTIGTWCRGLGWSRLRLPRS
jgi:hypothetical protein